MICPSDLPKPSISSSSPSGNRSMIALHPSAPTIHSPHLHVLALASKLDAKEVKIQITRITTVFSGSHHSGRRANLRSERHLYLGSDMFDTHHGERASCNDTDHLPAHLLDEHQRQDEEVEHDCLFEVNTKDDWKRGLAEWSAIIRN